MKLLRRVLDRLLGYRSSRNFSTQTGKRVVLAHDSGFFSNCSVLLLSLAKAKHHPVQIDVSSSFTHFAEKGSSFEWDALFLPPARTMRDFPTSWARSRVAHRLPHHSFYKLLRFSTTNQIRDHYFQLSFAVRARVQEIQESEIPVPIEEVLVVCLRGTDKGTEVRQSPLQKYVRLAKRIMKRRRNLRVWIQTDQMQIRDFLLDQLGPRSFSPSVLPVTEDSQVMHRSGQVPSKEEFSRDLLATTWLMSRAHSVITYTGNVGYWIALFRGNARRLYQLR
jgi:hypothetical protein